MKRTLPLLVMIYALAMHISGIPLKPLANAREIESGTAIFQSTNTLGAANMSSIVSMANKCYGNCGPVLASDSNTEPVPGQGIVTNLIVDWGTCPVGTTGYTWQIQYSNGVNVYKASGETQVLMPVQHLQRLPMTGTYVVKAAYCHPSPNCGCSTCSFKTWTIAF